MPLKMKDSEIMQFVQVKVEIGHRARPRAKPTKEGFTHDWTVYVRAPEGSNLAHFVEKVEFHLRDTFADPHRVVTKPPYHVSEVGYADFGLPIEIYFKNKGEPQKIKFNYNLFLLTHEPVNYVRCEKLTFVNPTDEFKKKLIKAGGVHVLPPGKAQFADLCGPPIETESLKKQKQPSTISSKVLALPPVDAQFADLFGSPIKVTKQKQPSIISSKEKVSEQMLNFSGDEKPSSSGKNIGASLNSTATQVKIYNKSKGHDAACTSSSSSSSSISKENIQKTQSSKEKPSCKESNNTSKMLPNPSPLSSHKSPSDHPIPSENNQTKIQVHTDKVEKYEHSLSSSTDAKKSKSEERKRTGSPVSAVDSSVAKKQRVSAKHFSNVTPMELREDLSFSIDISSESDDDFFGDITGNDLGADLYVSPTCGISKSSNKIHSMNTLKQLMDELDDDSVDDDDIIDTVYVFSQPKSAKNSPLVKSVTESSPLSCKINSDKSNKAISEISPTIKKPTISKDIQRKSFSKSVFEKKTESLNFNDTRNKPHHGTQPPTNTPSPVTKSKEGESSEEKSTCKIDSSYEVKTQRKTVRKYVNVKTKSSSSSESRKQDEKHKVESKVNTDKEEKSSKCVHSSSKSLSKGENHKKEKSSNRHRIFEIPTDPKKSKSEEKKRTGSPVSAVDNSMAKKQRVSAKHFSNVTPMELKEDLSFPNDISSESDDDFLEDITGNDLGADLYVSPSWGISKSSNKIHSMNTLKQLIDELDDDSVDDDDIIDTVDVFSQPKSAKNSPLVKSVTENSPLSCKINSDKSNKAISEISPTIKKPTISKDIQSKSFSKSIFEKKTESLNFNDTRNKPHHGTQPPTNTLSPVTKSKEGESSEEKSTCKIDSSYEVKTQRKTVRKYVNVKTKSSSSSESRKQDEKHKVESKVNTDKEEKSSKCVHSSSKSLSKGENHKKEKSSNRHRIFEIPTDPKKSKSEEKKRTGSPVSAVDNSMAKKQRVSAKHFSNVTPMELKEDLSFPNDISSESDDDFFGDITGNDLGADLDISPNCGISKTSNQIYSMSALKQLMHELEDSSADDEDDRKSEITTDAKKPKSEQRKRSGSPLSTLFGSMAKKQRVGMKHLSNDSLMELKEDLSRSR